MSSARRSREADEFGEFDEPRLAFLEPGEGARKPQTQFSQTASVATLLGVVALLFLVLSMVDGRAPSSPNTQVSYIPSATSGVSGTLRSLIPNWSRTKLTEDFHGGLATWKGAPLSNVANSFGEWTSKNGAVQPGRLRLWQPSMNLKDYQLEFTGQIEHKGLGWAFRAGDLENYYGTRIVITKGGPLPNADLVRYAMVNGHPQNRVQLPLPFNFRSDTVYRIKVGVRGDRFTTSVNGQLLDTWGDNRFLAGGIGFFAERGEAAWVRAVSLLEPDRSILSRLFLASFITPSDLMQLPH